MAYPRPQFSVYLIILPFCGGYTRVLPPPSPLAITLVLLRRV